MKDRTRQTDLAAQERPLYHLPTGGDVRVVVAYPNRYWIAMSNLGFQAVYKLLSEHPRIHTERSYLPEAEGETPKTFESSSPLSEAEILAISVSFETDYPNVLSLIAAAGVDLDKRLEMDSSPREPDRFRPLILGGGAALTLNPEPLANFFDAIVIGEGEEVIQEILSVYLEARDTRTSFDDLLFRLAQLEGVYVPRFYKISYQSNHSIDKIEPTPGVQARVERRYIKDIDQYPTTTVIQTPQTEFKSMFMTETGRGCEVGCRFCVAGYMYRPVRKRSREVLEKTVQLGLETSSSVGFVGAAVSSHSSISELASSVAAQGARASLSSIMSQRVTPELAASLSESEYKTVALAPEAGSETLRFRVGKRVCDEQILTGIRTLAENGIRNFKLYFIVGLPAETLDDVVAIGNLVARAHDAALEGARRQTEFKITPNLYLSVNPFIPKAWTPFQRHTHLRSRELKERLEIVRNAVAKIPNVEMKNESPRESYFQTVMSRGDRRVGDLLVKMHREDRDWRWLVQNGEKELIDGVPATDFYVYRTCDKDELLPWEVVDLRLRRSLLEREYEKTLSEDVVPLILRAKRELAQAVERGYENLTGESVCAG